MRCDAPSLLLPVVPRRSLSYLTSDMIFYMNATGSSRGMACSVPNCANAIGRKFRRTGNSSVRVPVATSAATHGVTIQVGAPICGDCYKVYKWPFVEPSVARAKVAESRRLAAEAATARSTRAGGAILGKRMETMSTLHHKQRKREATNTGQAVYSPLSLGSASLAFMPASGGSLSPLPSSFPSPLPDQILPLGDGGDLIRETPVTQQAVGEESIHALQQSAPTETALAAAPRALSKLQRFVMKYWPLYIEPNSALPTDKDDIYLAVWDPSKVIFAGAVMFGPPESISLCMRDRMCPREVTECGKLNLMLTPKLLNQLDYRARMLCPDLAKWIQMFRPAYFGQSISDSGVHVQDLPGLSAEQRNEYIRWAFDNLVDGDDALLYWNLGL
jgi:hypothetical protein